MKYRKFGRTNMEVSDISYGLWGMSGWSGSNDTTSLQGLQTSVDLGCNFFDTAWAYGNGNSDGLVGEILARNGKKNLFAASKIPPLNDMWPALPSYAYPAVFPAEHVLAYDKKIREKLRVDAIDVLQFHVGDDHWTNEPEFRQTSEELKGSGLIRWFGLSLNRWEPENGIAAIRAGLVDAVQVIYNIFDQSPEEKLFPVCRELKIGAIGRVPRAEGGQS